MNPNEETAARLRAALGRQNISRSELARRMDVNEMWIGRRLNGQSAVTVEDLFRLADALGTDPAALLPERASA